MGRTIVARRATTTIYALYDPRDGVARYVGRTVRALEERLLDHMQYKAAPNAAKQEWLEEMRAAGVEPGIRQLERVATRDAAFAEARWMHTLQAAGAQLLNVNRPGGAHLARDRELTPKEAAALLGCTDRSVRRWIARGLLAGRLEGSGRDAVYRTSEMAVRTFMATHGQGLNAGPLVATSPARSAERFAAAPGVDPLVDMLRTELSAARAQLVELARENGRLLAEVGRLEAEVALLRGQGERGKRQNGHAAGALARLVPWLRG